MIFSFGRNAKFKKLLKQLQTEIATQMVKFPTAVEDRYDGFPDLLKSGPPLNQMILSLGGLSFYLHALNRASFRPHSETLRQAIFDPTAIALPNLAAEMMFSLDTSIVIATVKEDTLKHVNLRGSQYSEAPSLLGVSADDKNSAVWLAACTIAKDVGHPKDGGLILIIKVELLRGYIELKLPDRVEALEALLSEVMPTWEAFSPSNKWARLTIDLPLGLGGLP
jgi:hypothetical protein